MMFETKPPEAGGRHEAELTLGELVLRHRAALAVLHRHGMDACCGGGLAVAEACQRHGVDLENLLKEVASAG